MRTNQADMAQLKELIKCKHAYETEKETWCAFNFDKECNHLEDPEKCPYNIKGAGWTCQLCQDQRWLQDVQIEREEV